MYCLIYTSILHTCISYTLKFECKFERSEPLVPNRNEKHNEFTNLCISTKQDKTLHANTSVTLRNYFSIRYVLTRLFLRAYLCTSIRYKSIASFTSCHCMVLHCILSFKFSSSRRTNTWMRSRTLCINHKQSGMLVAAAAVTTTVICDRCVKSQICSGSVSVRFLCVERARQESADSITYQRPTSHICHPLINGFAE